MPPSSPRPPATTGKKPKAADWQIAVTAWLARGVRATCRLRTSIHPAIKGGGDEAFILICWHNRLLILPACAPKSIRRRTRALASISRDGEAAARYIRHFGIESVRGSSSAGGYRSLLRMSDVLAGGQHVLITPDGPRGPRYEMQPGAVLLARKTGRAIIPISLNASRCWELHGWDRTQIAKPFSSLRVIFGDPIRAEELTEGPARQAVKKVRDALMAITVDPPHTTEPGAKR